MPNTHTHTRTLRVEATIHKRTKELLYRLKATVQLFGAKIQ